jgi:hypothetical protein
MSGYRSRVQLRPFLARQGDGFTLTKNISSTGNNAPSLEKIPSGATAKSKINLSQQPLVDRIRIVVFILGALIDTPRSFLEANYLFCHLLKAKADSAKHNALCMSLPKCKYCNLMIISTICLMV